MVGSRAGSDFLQVAGQANQRRLRVFTATLIIALGLSLTFTWLRPPQYRASARVEITPAVETAAFPRASAGAPEAPFLTQLQVLTSRPILELVADALSRSGYDLAILGPDPIVGMQSRLEALPVQGTNVVELVATGPRPELLAALINTTIVVYQDRLAKAYFDSSGELMARADEEVTKFEGMVTAKRRDVEAFRIRNNIVSLERDENEVLARVRNLNASLSAANDKVAAAEGKLNSLTESAASGQVVVRSRDDPTLASLEQRASQIREELRDLERGFTPDYMAKDPRVVNQRTRLAELERQIAAQRTASQQMALVEARQELVSAQGTAARLRNEMASGRQQVAQFTARFSEYKSQQEELAQLDAAYRDAAQRRAKLEASERARMPATKVLEVATTPQEPWRPLYWRDTGLSVGGSLLLALLTMWLVELFNRPEPQPAVVLIQPQSSGLLHDAMPAVLGASAAAPALAASAPPALAARTAPLRLEGATERTLLSPEAPFPRELREDEVSALVQAADAPTQVVILLLMSGLSLQEVLKLSWTDIDLSDNKISIDGGSGRSVSIAGILRRALAATPSPHASDVVVADSGHAATADSVDAQVLCAALDAGIADASQVNSACLRHTYIAYLVRQGIRFAELARQVGPLSAELLSAYSTLSPAGVRSQAKQIDVTYPLLRNHNA